MKQIGILSLTALLLAGCGDAAASKNTQEASISTEASTESSQAETETTSETTDPNADAIAEAIKQETSKVEDEPVKIAETQERKPIATVDTKIPSQYTDLRLIEKGKIEKITYTTYDYFGDGSEITKEANVFIPYNYDETKQYNVLYLMHGIGGDENEWGMTGNASKVKMIMDNLVYHGDIDTFIIVTPNGRSSANHSSSADYNSFYVFGQELRNDLIPYIDSHYSTYADYDENGYDLTAARDHRAMAGLSMGGMQTINIGIGECVDIISYFGAFSAAPTSNLDTKTAEILKDNTYPIHYFYNICGTEDGVAYASASAAAKNLPAVCDQFVDGENFTWMDVKGVHDFNVWYLGFYNFAQLAFQ